MRQIKQYGTLIFTLTSMMVWAAGVEGVGQKPYKKSRIISE